MPIALKSKNGFAGLPVAKKALIVFGGLVLLSLVNLYLVIPALILLVIFGRKLSGGPSLIELSDDGSMVRVVTGQKELTAPTAACLVGPYTEVSLYGAPMREVCLLFLPHSPKQETQFGMNGPKACHKITLEPGSFEGEVTVREFHAHLLASGAQLLGRNLKPMDDAASA